MVILLVAVLCSASLMTWALRDYAMRRNVLDIPSARSAHAVPTPRGGGVAIVLSVVFAIPVLHWMNILTPAGSVAFMVASVFIACIGFLDDHGRLNVTSRLLSHAVAAGFVMYWLHGFPSVHVMHWEVHSGLLANGFGFLYIVWMINLYNFMDGIDGLAALEAVCVCVGAALLYVLHHDLSLAAIPLVLSASVLGFLYWNWSPARIFMGDAGSGFLGCLFAVLSLQAARNYPPFFWSWLILLGVFIVDATYTLLRRAVRLETLYQPHAMHAYQHAAKKYASHQWVSCSVVVINVLWLWPLAYWAAQSRWLGPVIVLIAYTPLWGLAVIFRAGHPSA